jgi:uncharacterized repeat protein (TIGR01451 family)
MIMSSSSRPLPPSHHALDPLPYPARPACSTNPKHRGRTISILSWIVLLFTLASTNLASAAVLPAIYWRSKVEPSLLAQADIAPSDQPVEFLIYLVKQADLTQASSFNSKAAKGQFVFDRLTHTARRTQRPLIQYLQQNGFEFRSYWITNMIWVKAPASVLETLARRDDVARLYANPWVKLAEPVHHASPVSNPQAASGIEPNLIQVKAPDVWALGYTGQGVVIGGQDTGYHWDHPALKDQYRGWEGGTADHNFNWHDAIHEGNNSCGVDSLIPCDDYGHGTHTLGTMVGDDHAGNQVGMAPGARWIGCRNMRNGYGSPATYSECYEWFVAPTNLANQDPRPDLAPDVINNSWSCTQSEGCMEPDVLQKVVENVRAAGILTVHSAGNSGPSCSTVNEPPTIYSASFSVGAVNSDDTIASFSSRGPVSVDGSGILKPQVVAPGVSIRSSSQMGYTIASGTSMAAPHVSGLAALVISAQPSLRGDVASLESLIQSSAFPLQTEETCGGTAGQVPNNVYGWGRIDALAAVQQAPHHLQVTKTASAVILPGETLTYTLIVSHHHPIDLTTNLVLTDTLPANTSLLEATSPFTLDGNLLTWQLNQLPNHGEWTVSLTVQLSPAVEAWIENLEYGVTSDQVPQPAAVPPVRTFLAHYQVFLPLLP